jgi:hypothetical protein
LRREFIQKANNTRATQMTSVEPTKAQLGKPSAPNIPPLALPSWTTGRNSNAAHPTAPRLKNAITPLSAAFTESPFSSHLEPTAVTGRRSATAPTLATYEAGRQGGSREKRSRLLRARVILRPNPHGSLDDEGRRQHQNQSDCRCCAHTAVERGLRRADEG